MKKIFFVSAQVKVNGEWKFNIVNQIIIAKSLDEAQFIFDKRVGFIQNELDKAKMKVRIMSIMDTPLPGKIKTDSITNV